MRTTSRKRLIAGVVWLLSFGGALTVIGFVIDAPGLLRLQHQHAEVQGEVTRLLPETHGLVEVRYAVAGTVYKRALRPNRNPVLEGTKVAVYYSPQDPGVAVIGPPADALATELPSWLAGSLLCSGGVAAGVLWWMKWLPRWFPGRGAPRA
jgi:hypothetical protein